MTPVQRDLLQFIKVFQATNGYSPSFEEMKDFLRQSSKSGVYRILKGLEEQGLIKRLYRRARVIEVVENPTLPDNLSHFSTTSLAQEAKRRGLALGHVMRDGSGRRSFKEITA